MKMKLTSHLQNNLYKVVVFSKNWSTLLETSFSFILVDGSLYTFGRTGPRLGYQVEGRKQTEPRKVESLANYFVKEVSCGWEFTIGKASFLIKSAVWSHLLKNS